MKQRHLSFQSVRQPLYPNAADANYFTDKALEILAAILSGTGAITVMLFLITIA